jgi:hypothetical protein
LTDNIITAGPEVRARLGGGEVIAFPGRYRPPLPLPPDAQPNARERFVEISPYRGRWRLEEWDDGGGYLTSFPTKLEALAEALKWLGGGDAELRVCNTPLPERGP